jgi:hypothetical protein
MSEPVVVEQLSVRVVTGKPSEDPYGQGFSAIWAEVVVTDRVILGQLNDAKREKTPITLRCAMLDVTGCVTKSTRRWASTKFVLAIDDLRYRKPQKAQRDNHLGSVL